MPNTEHNHRFSPELRRVLALATVILLGHTSLAQELPRPNQSLPTAQDYAASNESVAITVAQRIDFLHNTLNEHPSNMCGPLAASLLVDAGALKPQDFPNNEVDFSHFWLANPDRLQTLLAPENFDQFVLEGSIWAQDFSQFSLEVGDFVYLEGGTFDHMLVITRVTHENNGQQAYSMTNLFTKDGFVISEEMLYNTSNHDTGLFFTSFTRSQSWTGQTGATRSYVFRPKRELILETLDSTE